MASVEFEGYFPPFKVTPVATVAAGDAFNAGLAVGLTEGKGIQESVWLAMASGAVSEQLAPDIVSRLLQVQSSALTLAGAVTAHLNMLS